MTYWYLACRRETVAADGRSSRRSFSSRSAPKTTTRKRRTTSGGAEKTERRRTTSVCVTIDRQGGHSVSGGRKRTSGRNKAAGAGEIGRNDRSGCSDGTKQAMAASLSLYVYKYICIYIFCYVPSLYSSITRVSIDRREKEAECWA